MYVCVCRFQVFVKGLDGRTITLDLTKHIFRLNMFDLRSAIHAKTEINPQDQRLVFAGKSLPGIIDSNSELDETLLKDLGITNNSTIHLSVYLLLEEEKAAQPRLRHPERLRAAPPPATASCQR